MKAQHSSSSIRSHVRLVIHRSMNASHAGPTVRISERIEPFAVPVILDVARTVDELVFREEVMRRISRVPATQAAIAYRALGLPDASEGQTDPLVPAENQPQLRPQGSLEQHQDRS